MTSNNNIILMYHSVSSQKEPEVIGSYPISFDRFKYQLDTLIKSGYESGKVSDMFALNENTNKKYFYITGDDGTVDWSRNVLQWCEDNEIYTHTGIITGPWEDTPVYPLAHIVQIVLSTRSAEELKNLAGRIMSRLKTEQLAYVHKIYSYENIFERRIIKGACNLIFQEDDAVSVIGKMTKYERKLLDQRFEKSEFYKQFKFAEIGVHTRTHKALDLALDDYVINEIDASRSMLLEKELEVSAFFTLPVKPKFGAVVDSLIEPLKERGYEGILTSYSGFWDKNSYVIPRIDACEMEKIVGIPSYKKTILHE